MSVSYFIRYDVTLSDRDEFMRYYQTQHLPILARWPGMRRVVLHTPVEWSDPWPVNRGRTVLLAQLEFDTAEALQAALGSAERAEARADFARLPSFVGTVVHQALAAHEAWRRT